MLIKACHKCLLRYQYQLIIIICFDRKEYSLDKEIAASGYLREVQEFDQEFEVGKTIDETEDGDDHGTERDETDSSEDEPAHDDKDVKKMKEETEELCKNLKDETTLEELKGTTEGESLDPVPEDPLTDSGGEDLEEKEKEVEESNPRKRGKQLQQEARMALIKQLAKAREARQEAEEKGEDPPSLEDFIDDSLSDVCSVRSFSTTASSIDPREVKHRTHRDLEKRQKKQISKKNIRVKGEANAFRRIKKQNEATVRDHAGFNDW